MKTTNHQIVPAFVTPPSEILRENVMEPKATVHLHDWAGSPMPHGAPHDFRPGVASGVSPQRIRARQTEQRGNGQSHVRVHRRSPGSA